MSFLDFFSSSGKAVDVVGDVAGGMISGIDKLFLTDEEKQDFAIKKQEMAVKTMTMWLEVQKVTAGESSIKSITRRMIAIAFIGVYLVHIVGASIVYQFSPEYAVHLFNTAKSLNTPVLTIIIFYFGYYAIANVIKAKKDNG